MKTDLMNKPEPESRCATQPEVGSKAEGQKQQDLGSETLIPREQQPEETSGNPSGEKERLYHVKYVKELEKDRAALKLINKTLDKAGMAIGDEHRYYTVPERVEHLVAISECRLRQVDELRNEALTPQSTVSTQGEA